MKNDLYSFVDGKLTHNQNLTERRIDSIHAFASEIDIRLKRLLNYRDDLELKFEDSKTIVLEKTANLSTLEERIESKALEINRHSN